MLPSPPTRINGSEETSFAQSPQKSLRISCWLLSIPYVFIASCLFISKNAERPNEVPVSLTAKIPRGSAVLFPKVSTVRATSSSISIPSNLSARTERFTASSSSFIK